MLKLTKPLAFIDLETTGLNVQEDRIVEICISKIEPNGSRTTKTRKLNPTIPISKESFDKHGISDEDVMNEPTFCQVAQSLFSFIEGCDIAGYNSNRFDIPVLAMEFERCGFKGSQLFKDATFIDVFKIYSDFNKRRLEDAYRQYTGKTLEGAHGAENDTLATIEVLGGIISAHGIEGDIETLSLIGGKNKYLDFFGKIVENEQGEAVFNFGKNIGKKVKEVDPSYIDWMLNGAFPDHTKYILKKHI